MATATTNVIPFPQRRAYAPPAPGVEYTYEALPFVRESPERHNYWTVPRVANEYAAYDLGREFAAHFIKFIGANPRWSDGGLLHEIAQQMQHVYSRGRLLSSRFDSKYHVQEGFFSHSEHCLVRYAREHDVYAEVDTAVARDEAARLALARENDSRRETDHV
jgi:hypothetical protein